MKRPFVIVVSFYALGLLFADFFRLPPVALFATAFLIVALVFAFEKLRPFLLAILLVLTGWTNFLVHTAIISPNDLRDLVGNEAQIATVRGTLVRTPQIKIVEQIVKGKDDEVEHSLVRVQVTEIRTADDWQAADGDMMVSVPGTLPASYFTGQGVEISGVIARPPLPLAEGLFNFRDYLQQRGIYYEFRTASTNDWKLHGTILPGPPLTDRFLDWSKHILAQGQPEDETLRLLWAMTLGWRTAFTGDISDRFLRAGTMHLFAIDGLRIALISGMLVTLLRVLRVARAWCGAIAIPIIWFYTAATGWESSAVRASVMMTIVLGGWALKRPADLLNSLGGAAFLILLWQPLQLLEASFQLSFFVMLTIGLLLPKLNNYSDELLKYDPLVPAELIPKWRRVLTRCLRLLAQYFALSLASWVGSIPLSALYFHLFSPISPLANLIAVPLGTLALMANLGALICGTWLPWATDLFNNAAWSLMAGMTNVSEWFTKIPGSYFYVPAPSWISIGIYYAIIIVVLGGWLKKTYAKYLATITLVLMAILYLACWEHLRGETNLTVLPLEGGHAVYVDASGRHNDWLVDCGSAEAVDSTLKPYLRAQGVNKIPRLVLTDGEVRNCGGAVALDGLFGIGELWTSPIHFHSAVYNANVDSLSAPPMRHRIFGQGESAGSWQVLWPPSRDDLSRADDNALVLRGNVSGTKVLLLSDLSLVGQSALMGSTNDLHADIVIAGLPGDSEPLTDALLDAIQPKLIIIADSEYPAMWRASRKLKERLEQREVPVLYTRDAGAVKIAVTGTNWTAQAMDGPAFHSK